MHIALDYDKTYTADPKLWDEFVNTAVHLGHKVSIVTMRNRETEAIDKAFNLPINAIFYTNRRAKSVHMRECGITIDIWIDDSPHFILIGDANG